MYNNNINFIDFFRLFLNELKNQKIEAALKNAKFEDSIDDDDDPIDNEDDDDYIFGGVLTVQEYERSTAEYNARQEYINNLNSNDFDQYDEYGEYGYIVHNYEYDEGSYEDEYMGRYL